MSQPYYSNADAYIGDHYFTLHFNVPLDAANPPPTSAFNVLVNNTGVTVSGVTVDSAAKTVQVSVSGAALTWADIIDFTYTDPTAGNDASAIQGTDGADATNFSDGLVVSLSRPLPAAPPTPALASSSDTGTSPADGITSDATPTLSGTADANATVKLYDTDGMTLLGFTTADGSGTWAITSSTLGDGNHTLKVTQTDASNGTSPLSTGRSVTIDTSVAAPTGLSLDAGSDSGTLGDGISNSTMPTVKGQAEANATVTLYDTNGTTVLGSAVANGAGAWSIHSSSLTEGAHTLTAKQIDVAGNVSVASAGFNYTLDTVGPTGIALSTHQVNLTSATNGSTVATLSSNELTWVTYGFKTGNGVNDADNGKFTISGTSLNAAQNLTAGSYHIYLKGVDAADNEAYEVFTIDVVNGPEVSSIARAGAASATVPGSASSVDYTVTFSQAVTGVDASDFTLTSTGTATGTIHNATGSGTTYTVTVDSLSGDGTLRLDLNNSGTGIQNGSSNAILSGYTAGQTFTLDHTTPSAPSTPAMTAGTDTGASSSDAITSNTTPVFTGTGEANATVQLFDTDGTTLLGTTTADGSGRWSITSSTLGEGAHTLTAKQTDAAGNVSAASNAKAVTIDTTAPAKPSAPTLAASSDSGILGDGITNNLTPTITGQVEANAKVKLYDTDGTTLLGIAVADGTGHWSLVTSTLAQGNHTLTVKQTDVSGNVSRASDGLNLTIDPNAPSTPPAAPVSTTTIDGVTVTQQTVTLSGGGSGTQVVVPVVDSSRIESSGNAGTADIPLVVSNNSILLLAQLTPGFGLTATGGVSQPAGTSNDHLVQAILAATLGHTVGDQDHLTGNGVTFLKTLVSSVPLLVETVTPVTGQTSPTGALTLTGTSTDSQHTALVIDASQVNSGSSLVLNGVDFAAIVGAANVTGNTSGQILTGDAAAQHFIVSSATPGSVFSGAGNDTLSFGFSSSVPSGGSTSILHGGQGNDTVTFNGAQSDYVVEHHEGYSLVTSKAQPDAHAVVINAETLTFSDASLVVQTTAAQTQLSGLYQSVLGRQADYKGFDYWAVEAKNGVSMGDIAVSLINSSEGLKGGANAFNGTASHDLEALYQGIYGRQSDSAGLAYWADAMNHGMTLAQVADNFVHGAEMNQHVVQAANWDFIV
ncbi:Ig-like domain-containing protein [Pseudomonas sp. SLFW]|uniref:Ig-like domain-containing protein n=1 Tax=Pseudomonas sp. SLFW TaxID=2683259 RepID=UPI001412DC1B|nr:Ig-like domain-containing protein [Pseudomonas sp. SLFW]NBB12263.1 DUF4214 domain-containing protein [Pseudomonas sp. SLFW]